MEFFWRETKTAKRVFLALEYPEGIGAACVIFSELYRTDPKAFFNVKAIARE